MSHMRSASQLILVYTNDSGGVFPFAGPDERAVVLGGGFDATIGGRHGLRGSSWTALFADAWSARGFDPAMKCPAQPAYEPGLDWSPQSVISTDGVFPNTLYAMSDALWLDWRTLRPGATEASIRIAPNSVASVTHPSRKAMLFELIGFCVPREADVWVDLGQTPLHPTSVSTVDGAVRRFIRNDGLETATGGLAFTTTVDGVRGRDLPERRD
ncbi:MAG: hypothetical protein ACIARR_08460 [Phycisphaerales bacterium JB059]